MIFISINYIYSYYWVPVSSTGKVSDDCIRNLELIRSGRYKLKFSIKKKKLQARYVQFFY